MKKIAIFTTVIMFALGCKAQYKEMLRAHLGPTNKVVVSIPNWAKSDIPPGGGEGGITESGISSIVSNIIESTYEPIIDAKRDLTNNTVYADSYIYETVSVVTNISAWKYRLSPSGSDVARAFAQMDHSNIRVITSDDYGIHPTIEGLPQSINADSDTYVSMPGAPFFINQDPPDVPSSEAIRIDWDVYTDSGSYESIIGVIAYRELDITAVTNITILAKSGESYVSEYFVTNAIEKISLEIQNVSATGSIVKVGLDAYVGSTNTIAIGNDSGAQGNLNSIPKTFANDDGETTYATVPNSALGAVAEGFQSLARGAGSVAIGSQSSGYGSLATSIGGKSYSHGNNALAIGGNAAARGVGAIQIGAGRNESNNTVQIGDYRILNADGTIPPERITSLNNGSETRTADALFRSADNVNTLWSYVYGDTVWIAVTNYMRTVDGVAPSFQLWEVRDGKTNCVYWSAEEIDIRVGDKIDVAMSNIVNTVVTQKADRAWAKYQSMTGADNPTPNDVTIISTPSVMLSGGYEWQRYVESANEVWVLKCNDLITLGADTNSYFRITDLEGETQFAIEKTASRLCDAVPTKTGFAGDYFEVTFEGNIQPTIYVSLDLANSAFIECNETENEYGLSCSWTQDASANTYKTTITHNPSEGKPSKMFVYGKVLQQGSTVVKHTAPSSFDGGIIINGMRYKVGTATINGSTVLTLTNGQAVNE